ncbi:MAG: hypothetical protein DMF57_03800 [Acidobacteria bacterium]|nr:MAG: hypothetical protein DMF57_03800 [Acidobacteriota bacterium]
MKSAMRRRARSINIARIGASRNIRSMASAIVATDFAGTCIAASAVSSMSASDVDVITAVPLAIASAAGRPKPSSMLGITRAIAPRYSDASCSCGTKPARITPSRVANRLKSAPTRMRFAGSWRRTNANASTSRSTFL